ncbi:SIR2 family protein [Colwellia sp. MB02u-10]|jgi:hypothetical protein|uniref:SIR2 family protein n=1 Tax=Colwellia sp. MB02u-10 TaxID=2759828 RepID=UPI0015F4DEBE|nr:SIR2 family protein [Colwellia sp. MB02u-10]MBA6340605.1 SIR2 family protein [Colwellia sp. MB02u-10]
MPFTDSLKLALSKKDILPLVGAGVSMSINDKDSKRVFPSWEELLESAAAKLKNENESDTASLIEIFLRKGDYQSAAEYAYEGLKNGHWHDFIQEKIDVDLDSLDEKSVELPKAIWKLSNQIITLNYDRILPWAYPGYSAQVSVLENSAIANLPNIHEKNNKPIVWHLHGHIDNSDKLILTPDSYKKLYPTSELANTEYLAALQTLKNVVAHRNLLFIGCSLDDAELLAEITKQNDLFSGNGRVHFALIKESNRSEIEKKLKGTSIQVVTFEDYGQPLIDKINEMAAFIETSDIIIDNSLIAKKETKVAFLSANPFGENIDYQPIIKELKKLPYSINCFPLTLNNLQQLSDYEYVFIASTVVKGRLVVEDEDISFAKIDFIDLQKNSDLANKKGVFIFLNEVITKEKLEGINFPLLVLPLVDNKDYKKYLSNFIFQIFNKHNVKYTDDVGLILNDEKFILPQDYCNSSNKCNNFIKNENRLPSDIDKCLLKNFIGRKEDLITLSREVLKLEDDNGFVTIIGSGGLGKTTLSKILAIYLAERGRFNCGVAFVDCEHLLNFDQFKSGIASPFNLEKAQHLEEHLSNQFDGESRLIILDNFETLLLLEDKEQILNLLSFMSEFASIIVTSRELLNIDGEIPHTLRPMTLDEAFELFVLKLGKRKLSVTEKKLVRDEIIENLLDRNPLAINIITSDIFQNTNLFELHKELQSDIFNVSEEDLSLFNNSVDTNIDRKKSLYGSILYSYNMLLDNEKEAFEKLALFPDGINIENLKKMGQYSKEKSIKKTVIKERILKKLQNKSLLEESQNKVKLQSIIGRFAERQFIHRGKDTAFFDSVFLYNNALSKMAIDLSDSESQAKRNVALKFFEENQKNMLIIIDYLNECSASEKDKVIYINRLSILFTSICSLSNFINILNRNVSTYSDTHFQAIKAIVDNSSYFNGDFDRVFHKIKKNIPLAQLKHLNTDDIVECITFESMFNIYAMEGNQAYVYHILNGNDFPFSKVSMAIDIGILEQDMSKITGFLSFEYKWLTGTLALAEIDEYLSFIHKKEHLERMQISYVRAKKKPYTKGYINLLVDVNPYTFGLKLLMFAFCESDLDEAKKYYNRGIENLEHIKYYYVEAIYWYAKFLKEHNQHEYNDVYSKGCDLAKKHYYRHLQFLFDELETPTGLVYNPKVYPLPNFESLVTEKEEALQLLSQ